MKRILFATPLLLVGCSSLREAQEALSDGIATIPVSTDCLMQVAQWLWKLVAPLIGF